MSTNVNDRDMGSVARPSALGANQVGVGAEFRRIGTRVDGFGVQYRLVAVIWQDRGDWGDAKSALDCHLLETYEALVIKDGRQRDPFFRSVILFWESVPSYIRTSFFLELCLKGAAYAIFHRDHQIDGRSVGEWISC